MISERAFFVRSKWTSLDIDRRWVHNYVESLKFEVNNIPPQNLFRDSYSGMSTVGDDMFSSKLEFCGCASLTNFVEHQVDAGRMYVTGEHCSSVKK